MRVLQKIFLRILLFLGFCILGIVVGYGSGLVLTIAFNTGLFTSWQKLNSEIKFIHIEEATTQAVWARAEDGKLYFWDSNCYIGPNCEKWIVVTEIPEDIHFGWEIPIHRTNNCQSESSSPTRLPGNVIDCVRAWLAGPEFGTITYYALVNDGHIWAWHNSGSMILDYVITAFCVMGGLILSIISFIIVMIARPKRRHNPA